MKTQDRYTAEFEKDSHATGDPNDGALQLYCIRQLTKTDFRDIVTGWVSNRDYKVDLAQEKRQVAYPRETIRAWFCAAMYLKNPAEFLAPMRKVFTDEQVRQGFLWALLPRHQGDNRVNNTLHAARALCDGKPVLESFIDSQNLGIEPLFKLDPVRGNPDFVTSLCRLTVGNGHGLAAETLNLFPAAVRGLGVRAFQTLLGVDDLFVEVDTEPFQRTGLNTQADPVKDLAVILVHRVVSGHMTVEGATNYWQTPAETRLPLKSTILPATAFNVGFVTEWLRMAMLLPNPKGFTARLHQWVDPGVLRQALESFVWNPPIRDDLSAMDQARLEAAVGMIMSGDKEKSYFNRPPASCAPHPKPKRNWVFVHLVLWLKTMWGWEHRTDALFDGISDTVIAKGARCFCATLVPGPRHEDTIDHVVSLWMDPVEVEGGRVMERDSMKSRFVAKLVRHHYQDDIESQRAIEAWEEMRAGKRTNLAGLLEPGIDEEELDENLDVDVEDREGLSEQWYALAALTDHPKEFLQHLLWWLGDAEALSGLNAAVRMTFPWASWKKDLVERLANRIAQGSMDLRTACRHLDDDDPLEIDRTLGTEPLDERWDVPRVAAWCRLSVAYGVGFDMRDLREHAPEHIVAEGIRQFYTEILPRQILNIIRQAKEADLLEFRPESIDILRQHLGVPTASGTGLPVNAIDLIYKQAYEVQQGNMGMLAALNGYPKDSKGDGEYAALIESVEPTELATYVVSIGAATPGFVLKGGGPIAHEDILQGLFRTIEGGEDECELRGYLAEAVASERMTLTEAMTLHTQGNITLKGLEGATMTQQDFVDAWCRIGLASGEGINEADLKAVMSAHIPPEDNVRTHRQCLDSFYQRFMDPGLFELFQEKRKGWELQGLAMNITAAVQHDRLGMMGAMSCWQDRRIPVESEVNIYVLDVKFWETFFNVAALLPTVPAIDDFMSSLEEWALPMDFLGGLRLYLNTVPDTAVNPFQWVVLKRAYQFIHRWPDQYLAAQNALEWAATTPVGVKGTLYTNPEALSALWDEFMEPGGFTSLNLLHSLTGNPAPTLAEKALATFRADAKEIALRTGVRRVRAALADKIAGWWARRTQPQRVGETTAGYEERIRHHEDAQRAFLSTDMGEAALALLVGVIWTQVGPSMGEGQVQEFGDLVAREIRISAGSDLLDGVLTEIMDAVRTTHSLPAVGTGIRVLSQEVAFEDADHEARQPALEQKKA